MLCALPGTDAYASKAKNAVPSIFSREANKVFDHVNTVTIPKFGILRGTDWSVASLAKSIDHIVTECDGDVYVGPSMCSGDENAVYSISENVYAATVEGVDTTIAFSSSVSDLASIADAFYTGTTCQPSQNNATVLTCLWPRDTAFQVSPSGKSRMWVYQSPAYGIDTALLTIACVIAFATLLERSKKTTRQASDGTIVDAETVPWGRSLFRDLVVSVVWVTTYKLTLYRPQHLLHPSLGVVIETVDNRDMAGLVFYACIVVNGIAATISMSRSTQPMFCRTTYETFLLMAMLALTPVSVAPLFHALLEASIAASVIFINSRDCLWGNVSGMNAGVILTIVSTSVFNCAVACMMMLPALVDCDAVPAGAEVTLAVSATLQIMVASVLHRA